MSYEEIISIVYIGYLIIMSLIALALFIKDKRLALAGGMRIKEKTLLGFTIYGGAIGALFGRIIARHKTNKLYFSVVIYLSVILQLAVLGLCAYLVLRG